MNRNQQWLEKYNLAKEYYEEHGDLLIPTNYIVIKDQKEIKLGTWVQTQKKAKKGNCSYIISQEQIDLLNEIGMVWGNVARGKDNEENTISQNWLDKYNLAKLYYEKYGNLLLPYGYTVKLRNKEIKLETWIKTQRQARNGTNGVTLNQKQIELLDEIGMIWGNPNLSKQENAKNIIIERWLIKYNLAKEYYEEHGDLLVPIDYIVKTKNEEVKLGIWIRTQRQNKKENRKTRLSQKQIDLLNEIGMVWYVSHDRKNKTKNTTLGRKKKTEYTISNSWLEKYNLAKEYYEKHGDLLIPREYRVIWNNKEVRLGLWIRRQRQAKNGISTVILTQKEIDLLDKIGMVWDPRMGRLKEIEKERERLNQLRESLEDKKQKEGIRKLTKNDNS